MRFVLVKVVRSEAFARTSEFRPWEVPILEMVFGAGSVTVVGEVDRDNVPYPDAASEYERLATRYVAPEGAPPFVQQVYGVGSAKLAEAIEKARAEAEARPAISAAPVVLDTPNQKYIEAEARALEADRAKWMQEKEEAAKAAQAEAAAKAAELAAREAQLAAREKALAEAEAALVRDRAEVMAALDAATQAPLPKADAPAKGRAKAQPISE
jgi:hypothetical protein